MNSNFAKILRFLLALILLVFGLNKFLFFMPMPELPEHAAEFMGSLKATGYVLPFVGVIEIFVGILLLMNKWVAFALLVLVPISINILLFHLFLDVPNIIGALLVVIFNIILIYKHWPRYTLLFH
ncbi:MAG: DoxX protein [Bacteroidetes bacterium HGW-Bacteroidetes-2]|nr:MAG: DoxX protein [Bacteroidetes bacterium HGW-Bacteroidetes-2]